MTSQTTSKPNYQKAQAAAEKIWKELCLSLPPIPILEVAKNYGLDIQETSFQGDFNVSGVLDIEQSKIYVNQGDTPEHKRFTIAHELGHWLLHKEQLAETPEIAIYHRRPIGGETDPKEKEANFFAANLLVPLNLLENFYTKLSERELAKIFAVSSQVIGYRLQFIRSPYVFE